MDAPISDQQAFFDQAAATWDELETDEVRSRLAEIVTSLGILAGAMILDVGCGTGVLFPLLTASAREQGHVVGLDISREMLRRAATKGYPVFLVQGDAHRPPLRQATFDWVICNAVLPHFNDKEAALTALGRCLVPGGVLVVCHGNSRQFINSLHRDTGGVVAEDRVPDPTLMAELLRNAGLEPFFILDGVDRYVALARKPSMSEDASL
ncbi:MAG: class I SAM-dependent methyltransferase [Anaerolineae bacterium]|nr:class I SAM-dependent methyltransferase [Anaerolineae bacterium]MDW8100164.1 class I SAM-dependent methyltransferase [Anaerolineae bacterium]